jgi:cephalosporin hydroxylase
MRFPCLKAFLTMNTTAEFEAEKKKNIQEMSADERLRLLTSSWLNESLRYKYSYNFCWMGRPIIQYPQDIIAVQEIIWSVKPDLIVETGIAHGGSLVFSASMLELLGGPGLTVGIDIDIRPHNRRDLEAHPLFKRMCLIEGSSTDQRIVDEVFSLASAYSRPMVILDSNHTHQHVLEELQLYSPLVQTGSYLIVLDTIVEDIPEDLCADRPWGRDNNPKTAVKEFLSRTDRFITDQTIENKLLITVAPGGFLRCIKG